MEFESLHDALVDCVRAAGGAKVVGHKLWPEKAVDAAQRHLLACLSEGKAERLNPDQVVLVLRLARAVGHHGGVGYILAELGYAPTTPIEPRDEAAELMRQYIEAVHEQKRTADRMEKAAARMGLRVAA